jgi:hypothetical protein
MEVGYMEIFCRIEIIKTIVYGKYKNPSENPGLLD